MLGRIAAEEAFDGFRLVRIRIGRCRAGVTRERPLCLARNFGVDLGDIAALSTWSFVNGLPVFAFQPLPQQHHRSGREKEFLHGWSPALALCEESCPADFEQSHFDWCGPRLSRKRHFSSPAASYLNLAAMIRRSNMPTARRLLSLPRSSLGRPSAADRTSSSRTGNHRGAS